MTRLFHIALLCSFLNQAILLKAVSPEDGSITSDIKQDESGEHLSNYLISRYRFELRHAESKLEHCEQFASKLIVAQLELNSSPNDSMDELSTERLVRALQSARDKANAHLVAHIDECIETLRNSSGTEDGGMEKKAEEVIKETDNIGEQLQKAEGRQHDAIIGELRAENGRLREEVEDLLRWKKKLANELSGLQRTMIGHERDCGDKSARLLACQQQLEQASLLSSLRCKDPSSTDCVRQSFTKQLGELASELEKRRISQQSCQRELDRVIWLLNGEQMVELNRIRDNGQNVGNHE